MAEPHVISTLRNRRDRIERFIQALEKQIKAARADLAHIHAVLRLFEVNGEPTQFPVHMGLSRVFARGELPALCLKALANAPDGMTTRELAVAVLKDKGMDTEDRALRSTVAYSIVNALRRQEQRGKVAGSGKCKGVVVWKAVTRATTR